MDVVEFILLLLIGYTLADDDTSKPCTSYRNIPGNCIHATACPKILQILKNPNRSADELKILRKIGCVGPKPGYVCCEFNEEGIRKLNETENFESCGTFSENKIMISKEVQIHSRSWMALLVFNISHELKSLCTGSLITKRYVLTAAHCFIDDTAKLDRVRLGEHHLWNSTYCQARKSCEKRHVDIQVIETILHEDFNNPEGQNDIALVKLVNDVKYRSHIRPICLPLPQELTKTAQTLDMYIATGWGVTMKRILFDVPMDSKLFRANCSDVNRTTNSKTQICAGGNSGDSCNGDSGGPLTYPTVYYGSQRFVLFGVASYGPDDCSSNEPVVYTNVAAFLSWISEKILY